jgi:hypothetical protein
MPNPLTKSIRLMRTINSRLIAISDGQDEMFRRLDGLEGCIGAIEGCIGAIEGRIGAIEGRIGAIEGRIGAIEGRIDDLSHAIEVRHVDVWKLVEERHSEMWKLITDLNNSLPMTVAMSTTESFRQLTETIRSDIADTRQEIVGVLSKVVSRNE